MGRVGGGGGVLQIAAISIAISALLFNSFGGDLAATLQSALRFQIQLFLISTNRQKSDQTHFKK